MQQNLQTAHDIFNRNSHSNPFAIKIPSPYATKHNVDIFTHAFILNKLALLPFYQNQRLTQLYKISLEYLINQQNSKYKNNQFVEGVVSHLQNWQINMSMFGVWPYTRACFYRIEQVLKGNIYSLEKVIVRRGVFQPNKQQFIQRLQNSKIEVRSQSLKMIINIANKQVQQSEKEQYEVPKDILLIDKEQCWRKLQSQFKEGKLVKQDIQGYLKKYEEGGLLRHVCLNIRRDNSNDILDGIKLRYEIFKRILIRQSQAFKKVIQMLSTI